MFFKCKHPAKSLCVQKDSTTEDGTGEYCEFIYITYHFRCLKCDEKVDVRYAKFKNGVEGFLKS